MTVQSQWTWATFKIWFHVHWKEGKCCTKSWEQWWPCYNFSVMPFSMGTYRSSPDSDSQPLFVQRNYWGAISRCRGHLRLSKIIPPECGVESTPTDPLCSHSGPWVKAFLPDGKASHSPSPARDPAAIQLGPLYILTMTVCPSCPPSSPFSPFEFQFSPEPLHAACPSRPAPTLPSAVFTGTTGWPHGAYHLTILHHWTSQFGSFVSFVPNKVFYSVPSFYSFHKCSVVPWCHRANV